MSKFHRGYKFKIYPTEEQEKQIDRMIDLSRYVYNWGIAKEQERYELYKQGLSEYNFYTFYELCAMFTEFRNDPNNEWLMDIPLTTARLALQNVENAYKKYFKGVTGHPKFKSKKHCKSSFNTRNDRFRIYDDKIKIEGINTQIALNFNPGLNYTDHKYSKPTVTRNNLGEYFISFNIEEDAKPLNIPKTEGVGIDLGSRQTLALSTGEIINQPKEKLDHLEHRRRKLQRHVTRDIERRRKEAVRTKTKYEDIPESKRARKRRERLNKCDNKIHNIKETCYHTATKRIVEKNPEFVCMETFRVSDWDKYFHKYTCHTSFYDITQKMKEKCQERDIPFIQAPQDYPSTKTCSNCGSIKEMNGKHTYKCPVCGMVEDRDINAAINLKNYGLEALYSNIGKIE